MLTFYYAVVCNDASGNPSEIAASDPATAMTNNVHEGVAVIRL
ncbi:MAG: hypothetical protein U5K00_07005 [Melioribacteraceae bacterium]|nr:hypothetical protein [Melioribacteraceae bacterium]